MDIGFVEKPESRCVLRSPFFPSKVGGFPAWLDLSQLPSSDETSCGVCRSATVFLLQIYAPDDSNEATFHRTIYIFCCRNPACHRRNENRCYNVFRCQLPKANPFYSEEPPKEDSKQSVGVDLPGLAALCWVCGSSGPKSCGKCRQARYCSKEHQLMHWKNGHKGECSSGRVTQRRHDFYDSSVVPSFLFPELLIVIEEEEEDDDDPAKTDEERMADYRAYVREKSEGVLDDDQLDDFETSQKDKVFMKFKKKIKKEPEQVVRYQRNGEILWVSSEHVPNEVDIPRCQCGSERLFEFQIMPQLLNYLEVDSLSESTIDWGTLVVYTCGKNCSEGDPYHKEFIWKQDFSS